MALLPNGLAKTGVVSFYPKTIDQSLRFEDGDTAYLTLASGDKGTPTNVDKCTISVWLKRGNLSSLQTFMFAGTTTNNTILQFDASDQIFFSQEVGGTKRGRVSTSAVFRDPSAWYHIVFAYDSSLGTAADRAKLWVNGVSVEFTNQTDAIDSGRDNFWFSDTYDSYIGYDINATTHKFDGYMAEYHGIDGQALDHTSFGELKSGIWIPKEYSGTYGTNGFYLDFADGAAIGDDESGNTNDWTATNLVASDVVPDSPTNNFAVLNLLAIGPRNNGSDSSGILSEGNLKLVLNGSADDFAATISVSSGKWYFEAILDAAQNHGCGWTDVENFTNGDYDASGGGIVNLDGFYGTAESSTSSIIVEDGSTSASANQFSNGDIIGYALNIDSGTLDIYHNGSLDTQITGIPQATYVPIFGDDSSTDAAYTANFGQDSTFAGAVSTGGNSDANGIGDFQYIPSGFLALCTSNLPNPAIDPAQDESPADYFGTLLWTGNTDTGTRTITDATSGVTGEVNFTPDWVWTKSRSATGSHAIFDVVRGANKYLTSNDTGAEITDPSSGYLDSFTDGGFVAQEGSSNFANLNTNGTTYVAWNWKANGAGSANSEGSITTTSTSANTTSGFSIIKWTGDGTIGHGLDEIPEMFIVKDLTAASSWWVWHKDLSNTSAGYMQLDDSSNGERTNTSVWRNAYPATATRIDVNTSYLNYSTDNYLALCFHSVEGFSKVGSYTGNGNADGTFVYTGFRPSFLLLRVTSVADDWIIWDGVRSPENLADNALKPNSSAAEVTGNINNSIDLVSNGFKCRNNNEKTNFNGYNYIYMAFAENPFKYSNAR